VSEFETPSYYQEVYAIVSEVPQGKVSARSKPGYDDYQRILLEEEGIEFGLHGRIDLKRYLWKV